MELAAYLDRIRFEGEVRADAPTLRRVHQQHLLHIPYENLSVQMGEPVGLDVEPIYEKIVVQGRGGWCYEMNGLLQWALERIGFDVTRMCAGVMRSARGDRVIGNHLVLAVRLDDETWMADVGFGDGLREAVPLRDGEFEQRGLTYGLELRDDGFWRFHNHEAGSAADFDFRDERADEEVLAAQCAWLQASEESPFVRSLVCQKFEPDAIQILRGRVRRTVSGGRVDEWLLNTPEELTAELAAVFGLHVDAGDLWPSIVARHEAVFGVS